MTTSPSANKFISLGAPALPDYKDDSNGLPALGYRFCLPAKQIVGSGEVFDASPNLTGGYISAALTDAAAWANAGYVTTVASAAPIKNIQIDKVKTAFDLATQSVFYSGVFNIAAPGAIINFVGNASSTAHGFYILGRFDGGTPANTGKIKVVIRTSNGTFSGMNDTLKVVCDGTDHTIGVAIDGKTKELFVFVDGVLVDAYCTHPATYVPFFSGSTNITTNFCIGSNGDTSASVDTKSYGHHLLVFDGALPLNIAQIARRVHDQPTKPLLRSEVAAAPTWSVFMIANGQSNEQSAGESPDTGYPLGRPTCDPVYPRGSSSVRSLYPKLAALAGNAGTKLSTFNNALGSTSITDSMVGRVRNWVTGMGVMLGTYVLSAGGFWKCNATPSLLMTSTVQPTGTSNTTGADGVPWLYLGVPAATDVAGTVYAPGSARFDPNGYVAIMVTALTTARSIGAYDKKIVVISFGQGDKAVEATTQQYALAHTILARYLLSKGADGVGVGLSCSGSSAGLDTYYTDITRPGMYMAQSMLSNDVGAFVGPDLFTTLGPLVDQSANPDRLVPGVNATLVHMNNAAYALASRAWYDAILKAGFLKPSI